MSNFGLYHGKDFIDLKLPKRDWLVENLIRAGDSVILVGNEKSGKSLFIFQLICSLTSCHPFIDIYNVPRPLRVVYVQLEGELGDSQDRMKRLIKSLDINLDFMHFIFQEPLSLQFKDKMVDFSREIIKHLNPGIEVDDEGRIVDLTKVQLQPDIIIIDPIYFAFTGSLSDDNIVRQFVGNMRIMKDIFNNCAMILVHHTHKTRFDWKGKVINEGDEALFGSKFLKAWADHILMFMYDQTTRKRTMLCNTQRSGDIVKKFDLRLVEPDPLYFKEDKDGDDDNMDLVIVEYLNNKEFRDGLSARDIIEKTDMCRSTFYKSIKRPLAQELVVKLHDTRPIRYVYNFNRNGGKG
jgi:hypothetical protein